MTDDVGIWVIAGLEVVTAVVIAGFWIAWFRRDHDEAWLPEGYVQHERVFVFSDAVLAALLVACAILLLLDESLGRSLSLVAGGMLAFLGILDAGYFWQTRMFARERGGVKNTAIVITVLVLSVILTVRFA